VGAAAGREVDAEEALQGPAHLAVRQPGRLVQIDDGRPGVGPELGGRGPEGVGRLERVAALDAPPTTPAVADVDVEPAVGRLPGDLDLVLVVGMGFLDGAAAVEAGAGQPRLVDLVDPLGRRAVRPGAVVRTGLAAGFPGLGLGRPLGERGGLALAGALVLFEQAGEPLDLGLQLGDAALQRLAAGTGNVIHEGIVAKGNAGSPSQGE
jgi:hypothetical protein